MISEGLHFSIAPALGILISRAENDPAVHPCNRRAYRDAIGGLSASSSGVPESPEIRQSAASLRRIGVPQHVLAKELEPNQPQPCAEAKDWKGARGETPRSERPVSDRIPDSCWSMRPGGLAPQAAIGSCLDALALTRWVRALGVFYDWLGDEDHFKPSDGQFFLGPIAASD